MLIAMQYSEQPDIIENNVPIMNNSQEDSQVEEQVPVNESANGLEIDMESSKEKAVPCPEMLLENTLPVEDALKDDTNSPPEIEMIDEILCSPKSQIPELTICNEDQPPNLSKMEEDLSLVSLSVFGVRFRCPICEYIDVNVRFVRDHMKQCQ